MTPLEMDIKSICSPDKLGLVLFSNRMNFTTAFTLCKGVGGWLTSVDSKEEEAQVQAVLAQDSHCYEGWIDLQDVEAEGTFRSATNYSKVLTADKYQHWDLGEPNGDIIENCIAQRSKGWNDYSCNHKACAVCYIPKIPIYTMRGLCFGTQFDADYGWTGNETESRYYHFQGFTKSMLTRDVQIKQWVLSLHTNPYVYATCNETGDLYPFGTYNWYFFNDTCTRAGPSETVAQDTYKYTISFTSCSKDEFSCNDGSW